MNDFHLLILQALSKLTHPDIDDHRPVAEQFFQSTTRLLMKQAAEGRPGGGQTVDLEKRWKKAKSPAPRTAPLELASYVGTRPFFLRVVK